MRRRRRAVWVVVLAGAIAAAAVLSVKYVRSRKTIIDGAVITANRDPRKQRPVAGVEITATDGISVVRTSSDPSGQFTITLPKRIFRGHLVTLRFRHMDYEPLDMKVVASGKLYVAEMVPISPENLLERSLATQTISPNVTVRYTVKTATVVDVGTTVKAFVVPNDGNAPCSERPPCSPDGKWKASENSITLDAGPENELRNFRASCIAGPCPFTKIDPSDLDQAGSTVTVTATAWSDTATFLAEAEVVHPMISDLVRTSYPVVFGDALNFTLPPAAEGVSLQADLNGQSIVFPLGPDLILTWADCNVRENPDQTRVYRCTLKPGYRWLHSAT
ncbi:MAG TPA: hypothetical protein VLW06_10435 [Terriglobales bacterium]|nr:hypothetical protein [Terriglobales bacterium]